MMKASFNPKDVSFKAKQTGGNSIMPKSKWMALFLACFLVAPAFSQDDQTITQVITFSVKTGMNVQFEEVVSAFREASRRQGQDNYWLSAQSVSGDPVYRFHVNRSAWGDLSSPGPQLVEVFGAEEAARLMGLLADSVASEHVAFFLEDADGSYTSPAGSEEPPEGLVYIDFTLNAGTAPMFLEMVRAQKVASSALYPDESFGVSVADFGASGPRTILVLQSFSDLDRESLGVVERLFEHFGQEEGARLVELASQSIASFETTLFRTRPDLNYQPE